MDHINKLKEIEIENERLFSEAFGRQKLIFNKYRNGNGYVNGERSKNMFRQFSDKNLTYLVTDNAIWTDGGVLEWLWKGSWSGDWIIFKQDGIHFSGLWKGGDFKGESFFTYSKPYQFVSGRFMGKTYRANNETYMAGPASYYSGMFEDDAKGVLGKEYLKDGEYKTGAIDLFLIPAGKHFIINGIQEFKVKQGLGKKGTDFIFFDVNKQVDVPVQWETIRAKYEAGSGAITIGNGYELPGLMKIDVVNSLKIGGQSEVAQVFNLNSIGLGDESIALEPANDQQKVIVNNYIKDLANGTFMKTLKRAKWLIQNDVITGYAKNRTLQPLFNYVPGDYIDLSPDELKEADDMMKYIASFIFYFMPAVKNAAKKTQVFFWLKKFLEIDKYIKKEKPKPEENSEESEDGEIPGDLTAPEE